MFHKHHIYKYVHQDPVSASDLAKNTEIMSYDPEHPFQLNTRGIKNSDKKLVNHSGAFVPAPFMGARTRMCDNAVRLTFSDTRCIVLDPEQEFLLTNNEFVKAKDVPVAKEPPPFSSDDYTTTQQVATQASWDRRNREARRQREAPEDQTPEQAAAVALAAAEEEKEAAKELVKKYKKAEEDKQAKMQERAKHEEAMCKLPGVVVARQGIDRGDWSDKDVDWTWPGTAAKCVPLCGNNAARGQQATSFDEICGKSLHERRRAEAYSRVNFYLLGDGEISDAHVRGYFSSQDDRQDFVADVKLLAAGSYKLFEQDNNHAQNAAVAAAAAVEDEDEDAKTAFDSEVAKKILKNYGHCFCVSIKGAFAKSIRATRIKYGDAMHSPDNAWPATITDNNFPTVLLREGFAAYFGADGLTPVLGDGDLTSSGAGFSMCHCDKKEFSEPFLARLKVTKMLLVRAGFGKTVADWSAQPYPQAKADGTAYRCGCKTHQNVRLLIQNESGMFDFAKLGARFNESKATRLWALRMNLSLRFTVVDQSNYISQSFLRKRFIEDKDKRTAQRDAYQELASDKHVFAGTWQATQCTSNVHGPTDLLRGAQQSAIDIGAVEEEHLPTGNSGGGKSKYDPKDDDHVELLECIIPFCTRQKVLTREWGVMRADEMLARSGMSYCFGEGNKGKGMQSHNNHATSKTGVQRPAFGLHCVDIRAVGRAEVCDFAVAAPYNNVVVAGFVVRAAQVQPELEQQ